MPAKFLDYAPLPTTYTIEVTDNVGASEYVSRKVLMNFSEVSYVSDFKSVGFGKSLLDSLAPRDYIVRKVVLNFKDEPKASDLVRVGRGVKVSDSLACTDRISKGVVLSQRDTFIGEFFIGRRVVENFPEATAYRETIAKDTVKNVYDTGRAVDVAAKDVLKLLKDLQKVRDYLKKGTYKPLVEKVGFVEIVTKIGFTLTGEKTRRVYFLPDIYKVHWDIIEDEDHNVKVDACRKLYDLFIRVRDKISAEG
jgi:hypothetical protein